MVSDLNKNFGGSTDLAKKRNGSADLHTPIHPLPWRTQKRDTGADPGEVKWVNFHPLFSEPSFLFFYLLSLKYWNNIWFLWHYHKNSPPISKSWIRSCNNNTNTRTVQIAEFREISHLLNQHYSSLARHVNATSRKSLEIQALSITKPRTHSEWKFVWILVFSCSYTSWK